MCVDQRGKCEDVYPPFFTYGFPVIIISLIMKLVYIHMSSLYIHEMAKRKQKKFLHLTLHH